MKHLRPTNDVNLLGETLQQKTVAAAYGDL